MKDISQIYAPLTNPYILYLAATSTADLNFVLAVINRFFCYSCMPKFLSAAVELHFKYVAANKCTAAEPWIDMQKE